MLQYLFSADLKKFEFFHTRAVSTLISTCAFSVGTSEKHYPCDLWVSDGESWWLLRNPLGRKGSRKYFHSFLSFLFHPYNNTSHEISLWGRNTTRANLNNQPRLPWWDVTGQLPNIWKTHPLLLKILVKEHTIYSSSVSNDLQTLTTCKL